MSSFDEREKGFEKKFAHDEELQFKISARKNKYLGEWAEPKRPNKKGETSKTSSEKTIICWTTGNPKVEIIAMVKIAAEIPRELRTYLTDSL